MKLKKDNRGAMSVTMLGFTFFIVVICLLAIEMIRELQSYSTLETYIQRSLTASVQQNISYKYRADGKLYLYIDSAPEPASYSNGDGTKTDYEGDAGVAAGHGAWTDFRDLLKDSLGSENLSINGTTYTKYDKNGKVLYIIQLTGHSGTDRTVVEEPYMKVDGTITFYPMFSTLFGQDNSMKTNFSYKSKEFHVAKVQQPTD